MSSDPIEVLRRAADELRRADALANKCGKINRRKVIGRAADNNLSVILSALDSLSAPQPPAEAQADHCTDHQRHVWGCRPCEEAAGKFNETAEAQPVEKGRGVSGRDMYDVDDFLARENPPLSAPVGVEGLPEKWRREAPRARVDVGEDAALAWREAVYWCAFQLEAALAQQPAAVDEAVVGQASGFIEFDYSDDDNCACCPGKHAYCRRVKWDGQSAKDMVDEFARKHANEGKRVLVTLTVAAQQGGES